MPPIQIIPVQAEGSNFQGLPFHEHGKGAMLDARFNGALIPENFFHFLRRSGGADIKIMGRNAQHPVPYAAPHHIGRKARFPQHGKRPLYRSRQ